MPRAPRIDAPGLFQHVIARGVERRRIFIDNKDRLTFLDRLANIFKQTDIVCYSWALMPNHFHLLLKSGDHPLGNTMKRLLGGYALYFNLRHKRDGHLFQNRYKSIVVESDSYLTTLVSYIHLNPYKAKIVEDINKLAQYRWSGHAALLGRANYKWQDTEFVLDCFGGKESYLKHIPFAAQQEEPDLEGGGLYRSLGFKRGQEIPKTKRDGSFDHRILGTADFALGILKEADDKFYKPTPELLETLLETVCRGLAVNKDAIAGRSREQNLANARGVFASLAKTFSFTGADIAKRLNITEAGVTKAVARGNLQMEIVSELRDQVVSIVS